MTKFNSIRLLITLAVSALLASPVTHAAISGVTGTTFYMSASEGYISVADGGSIYTWGYSVDGLAMQLPGPTLIVTEGDTVTINLTNHLPKAAGNE
jgi:FtsP/CotA-like multicopper oxidase with cupredoxin domain